MAGSARQKMKLLRLMQIFQEQSDEAHPLTIADLISALNAYGIQAERKALYSDIEMLSEFGLDIERQRSKTVGYYVANRTFELPELKLLVDAVQSSRFITTKKSRELIKKLATLTSRHQAQALKRMVFMNARPKALNECVYYNVDAIHAAIHARRKIRFKYFDYTVHKKRQYRKEGRHYLYTPLALCWNDDKYYLICYNAKYDNYTHFRVDRMSDVDVTEVPADLIDRRRFNAAEHSKRAFGMFSGEPVHAHLRFGPALVNAVLDAFGTNLPLTPCGERFDVQVDVSDSPVFLSWMFQFGGQAEIIGPPSLRTSMANLLAQHAAYLGDT